MSTLERKPAWSYEYLMICKIPKALKDKDYPNIQQVVPGCFNHATFYFVPGCFHGRTIKRCIIKTPGYKIIRCAPKLCTVNPPLLNRQLLPLDRQLLSLEQVRRQCMHRWKRSVFDEEELLAPAAPHHGNMTFPTPFCTASLPKCVVWQTMVGLFGSWCFRSQP